MFKQEIRAHAIETRRAPLQHARRMPTNAMISNAQRRWASLLVLALGAACSNADAIVDGPPAPEVSVAEVITKSLNGWEDFTGRLEERERIDVRPRVGGYIEAVHFEDGAHVSRGQLLFEIDARPFQAELDRASAEVEQARSQLELARLNHERGERLLPAQVIAKESADKLAADEASARAVQKAARASLQTARLNREFTRVRADIDGRASRALIRPGNLVTTASILTTVVSEGELYAYFDVDEATYLRMSTSGRPKLRNERSFKVLMGLATETGYPHEGRLDFLDNAVDPRTGMIRMRARFENGDDRLTPGLFARVRVVFPDGAESVLIDDRAVSTDLSKKYVFVLDAADSLQYREVTLGGSVGDLRVVKQGLTRGDVIVVNGLQRVQAGVKVAPKRVAMSTGSATLTALEARPDRALARTESASDKPRNPAADGNVAGAGR
jgi:multidrug efflux system membrane fusion protein